MGSDLDIAIQQEELEEKKQNVSMEGKIRNESALFLRENSGIVERNVLPNDEMLQKHLSSMKIQKDESSLISLLSEDNSRDIHELPSLKSLKGNLKPAEHLVDREKAENFAPNMQGFETDLNQNEDEI